jgi:hypothetical protein
MARVRALLLSIVAAATVASSAAAAPQFIAPPADPCLGFTTCVQVEILVGGLPGDPAGAKNSGTATVTSVPAGINCRIVDGSEDPTSTCIYLFRSLTQPSIDVVLTVTPAAGSLCWDGFLAPMTSPCTRNGIILTGTCATDCTGPAVSQRVHIGIPRFALMVTKSGVGSGSVSSTPAGISCGPTCSENGIPFGSKVTLTAAPDKGAVFQAWTGACNGQGPACTLTITADASTNAVFGLPSSPPPTTPSPTTTTATPPTPPPPTQQTTPPAHQTSQLTARIVYATAVRDGKHRLLKVRVRVSEPARAQVRLLKNGFERLEAETRVKQGDNTITRPIGASFRPGTYALELVVRDAKARQKTYHATVLLPK